MYTQDTAIDCNINITCRDDMLNMRLILQLESILDKTTLKKEKKENLRNVIVHYSIQFPYTAL